MDRPGTPGGPRMELKRSAQTGCVGADGRGKAPLPSRQSARALNPTRGLHPRPLPSLLSSFAFSHLRVIINRSLFPWTCIIPS